MKSVKGAKEKEAGKKMACKKGSISKIAFWALLSVLWLVNIKLYGK